MKVNTQRLIALCEARIEAVTKFETEKHDQAVEEYAKSVSAWVESGHRDTLVKELRAAATRAARGSALQRGDLLNILDPHAYKGPGRPVNRATAVIKDLTDIVQVLKTFEDETVDLSRLHTVLGLNRYTMQAVLRG